MEFEISIGGLMVHAKYDHLLHAHPPLLCRFFFHPSANNSVLIYVVHCAGHTFHGVHCYQYIVSTACCFMLHVPQLKKQTFSLPFDFELTLKHEKICLHVSL